MCEEGQSLLPELVVPAPDLWFQLPPPHQVFHLGPSGTSTPASFPQRMTSALAQRNQNGLEGKPLIFLSWERWPTSPLRTFPVAVAGTCLTSLDLWSVLDFISWVYLLLCPRLVQSLPFLWVITTCPRPLFNGLCATYWSLLLPGPFLSHPTSHIPSLEPTERPSSCLNLAFMHTSWVL